MVDQIPGFREGAPPAAQLLPLLLLLRVRVVPVLLHQRQVGVRDRAQRLRAEGLQAETGAGGHRGRISAESRWVGGVVLVRAQSQCLCRERLRG